jgi:hypothetical protein
MEQAKLVGVGYMGRADRVTRVLRKMVEDAHPAYDFPAAADFENASLSKKRTIAGFYFGFAGQALNLSLYTKITGRQPGMVLDRTTCPMAHKKNGLH